MTNTTIRENAKPPHPVDIHVGAAVRVRRRFLGISQSALADAVDLTFQQVQKYERGSNRISASMLFKISQALKMPIERFFDGLDDLDGNARFVESTSEKNVRAFLMTTDGIALAQAFPGIRTPALRRKVLELVAALANLEEG